MAQERPKARHAPASQQNPVNQLDKPQNLGCSGQYSHFWARRAESDFCGSPLALIVSKIFETMGTCFCHSFSKTFTSCHLTSVPASHSEGSVFDVIFHSFLAAAWPSQRVHVD
jgi:hypothetical protein